MNASNPYQFSLAWLLAYVTAMAMVCGTIAYGRWQALQIYGTAEAKDQWHEWRTDVVIDEFVDDGPVKRRVPQSSEPPALVLMRDHFAVCLGLSLLLTSILFGTFMVLIRGAFSPASQFVDRSPPEPQKSR